MISTKKTEKPDNSLFTSNVKYKTLPSYFFFLSKDINLRKIKEIGIFFAESAYRRTKH